MTHASYLVPRSPHLHMPKLAVLRAGSGTTLSIFMGHHESRGVSCVCVGLWIHPSVNVCTHRYILCKISSRLLCRHSPWWMSSPAWAVSSAGRQSEGWRELQRGRPGVGATVGLDPSPSARLWEGPGGVEGLVVKQHREAQ